jgi:hypothetical protein
MELFERLAAGAPKPATLLDVGGTTDFWRERIPDGFTVTLLNVFEQPSTPRLRSVVGDGCNMAQFGDKSFDVVFSNSVLFLVGDWERQQQLAREIRRVGCRYFVQTANRGFPIDWRTLVPLFHWLSPKAQAWWFERVPVGRYKKAPSAEVALHLATRARDLNFNELQTLFPEGDMVRERVFGLTKSLMVHYGFNHRAGK